MKNTILIDTNLILRLLIGDIPIQLKKSQQLFKKIENKKITGLISILVINELIWILEKFYHQKKSEYIPLILRLISLKNTKILEIKKQELIQILRKMKDANLDFTDLYLLFSSQKLKNKIASFDKKLNYHSRLPGSSF
ncbi:PIN domain-containing protein [Candidatus Shapirobacteria bacterium]|nr:PIN domain-containing protein [Candidatus Shapirobacteria bacterium]